MQFESKTRRLFWMNVAFSALLDVLIAYAIAWATSSGVVGAIAAFIGLQALSILLLLKGVIATWTMFWAVGRKASASALLSMLRQHKMPEPGHFETSPQGYLENVAADADQPIEVRLFAAANLGSMAVLPQVGRLNMAIQTSIAFEDALKSYKDDFARLPR